MATEPAKRQGSKETDERGVRMLIRDHKTTPNQ